MMAVMVMVMGCGGERGPVARNTFPAKPEEQPAQRLEPAATEPASSGEPSAVSAASRELAQHLAEVRLFVLGPAGPTGVTSSGEKVALLLSREPDAIEAFTWLGQRIMPAPRLYAYWALRTLAPDRAAALAEQLRRAGGPVERISGCFRYTDAVTEVLAEIAGYDARRAMPRP
jgi:hypothetical protein